MIKIRCSKKEKELIRQVIDLQLESLRSIVEQQCHTDLLLFCIEHEVDKEGLLSCAQKNIERFMKVKDNPNLLFFLDSDNLSIFRHILANLPKKKFKKTKKKVWRRIFQVEKILTLYNPN